MNFAPKSLPFAELRLLSIVAAVAFFTVTGKGAQYMRGQLIPEVRLKNGTVLRQVTVTAVGSTSVVARWEGGMGSLPLTQLPEAMRTELVAANPVKVAPSAQAAVAPAATVAAAPNLATAELPTEIKLTNGFTMHKASVTRWDTNSALITYQGGIVSVRFQNMAPEHRAIFEARKEEALANQAKEDASRTTVQDNSGRDERVRQEKEAADREAAEKKAEEINNGVSFHYLVKGMTKQQAIKAFGVPPDDKGDTFFYISRGRDKYGNAADRTLVFRDGVLVSWRDVREGDSVGAVEH